MSWEFTFSIHFPQSIPTSGCTPFISSPNFKGNRIKKIFKMQIFQQQKLVKFRQKGTLPSEINSTQRRSFQYYLLALKTAGPITKTNKTPEYKVKNFTLSSKTLYMGEVRSGNKWQKTTTPRYLYINNRKFAIMVTTLVFFPDAIRIFYNSFIKALV